MIDKNLISNEAENGKGEECDICLRTKPNRRPVPKTPERSGDIVVQVDYMPVGHSERGWKGEVGAYVYSGRESKVVKVYPVKGASTREAIETLDNYMTMVAPDINEKFTHVQTDPGSQFTSKEWSEKCTKLGIKSRYCPVDHQAINGQVERIQGLLAQKVRTLLTSGNLHIKYWPLALETATYLLNRTPHTSLGGRTPLEVATGKLPSLDNTRVFGCAAYVQILKIQRKGKFADTAWRGILVGYSTDSPEWLILNPKTSKIRKAYSVKFNEYERGFKYDQGSQWAQIFNAGTPEENEIGASEETEFTAETPRENIAPKVATIPAQPNAGTHDNVSTRIEDMDTNPESESGIESTEDMS